MLESNIPLTTAQTPSISALLVFSLSDEKDIFLESLKSLQVCVSSLDEIVIVFNGVSDQKLEKFIKNLFQDSICKLVFTTTESFVGFGDALNLGLNYVTSEWIMRIDPDDINLSTRIPVFKIMSNLYKFDIFSSSVYLYSRKNGSSKIKHYKNFRGSYKKFLWLKNPIAHPSVIIKKSILVENGGYRNISFMEDYDLWLRLVPANVRFFNINMPLIMYNVDDLSQRRKAAKVFKSELKILKTKKDFLNLNYFLLFISFIVRAGFYISLWFKGSISNKI